MRSRTGRRLVVALALVVAIAAAVPLATTTASDRALAAEADHVAGHLERAGCLTDWGADEGAATRSASVTGVTADGLRVRVQLPYAYTTQVDGETVYADTSSEAVYEVGPTSTRRVSGDEISPCS